MYTRQQLSQYAYFREVLEDHDFSVILDPLTGLVSRRYILGFVHAMIDAKVPFTFGMLDLDNFKFINDTYGHYVGDQVLIYISNALSHFLDGYGVAGRFGGDELLWINFRDIRYADKKAFLTEMYAENKVLRQNARLEGCSPFITGTIGCATFPDDAGDFDSLFGMIDKTLYRGKNKGRNCYIIYVKEKHEHIEIRKIARSGIYTSMSGLVRLFEMVPGMLNRLQSVTPRLMDELRVSDLYYVGPHRVMRSVRNSDYAAPVGDIDRLMDDEVFCDNRLDHVRELCPALYGALKSLEVETLMVARIGMCGAPADGYLICAEPRSLRIWQEDECALLYFLAKMVAAQVRIDGEQIDDLPSKTIQNNKYLSADIH